MPTKTTFNALACWNLIQPQHHLAAMQAVGAAQIFLAGASRKTPRAAARRGGTKAATVAVKLSTKIGVDPVETLKPAADRLEMRLRIGGGRRKARIRSTDPTGKIAGGLPIVDPDRWHLEIDHGEIAGLDIDKQRAIEIGQRAQQAGLADAGRADDQDLGAALLVQGVRLQMMIFMALSPSLELSEQQLRCCGFLGGEGLASASRERGDGPQQIRQAAPQLLHQTGSSHRL